MNRIERGAIEFDVEARHRQVIGDGPRIRPVPQAEMSAEERALCIEVREGVGVTVHEVIPDYMLTMVKHPGIFGPHMHMGSALFHGRIPVRERELAVLRIGWLCRAPYEWGQHVVISQRYGMAKEDIERVTRGSSAEGWSEHEAAILRGVEELIADAAISDETWAVLAKSWDEAQLIEFPMMVGQYVATAYVQNSLRTAPEGGITGLSQR